MPRGNGPWSITLLVEPHAESIASERASSMNPVMSDLAIFVQTHEIEAGQQARRRASLVREASRMGDGRGWFRRMVDGVHQFVDPRGFALAHLPKTEATEPASQSEQVTRTVTAANLVELVCDGREPVRDERLAA